MPWIQIRVSCDETKVKKISSMLQGSGAQAVTYMDAQDTPVYEPPLGTTKLWANTVVIGLYEADVDPFKIVRFIEKNLGSQVQCKVEQLEDKDWVREWMEHFHPMQFGKKLWICPSWCEIPDINAVNVMLARDNAERNNVSKNFELYLVDERPEGLNADLVVANILAGPLRELAPLLQSLVKKQGHIALSGILESQAEEINRIYGQWFDMSAPNIREEWSQLSGIKR